MSLGYGVQVNGTGEWIGDVGQLPKAPFALTGVSLRDNTKITDDGLAFFQGQYTQGTALLAAGAVIVALPVVALYIFLQRHFIKGMIEGAVRE